MPNTRVKRVIAGPGGGKTTGLVNEVLEVLPSLMPHRYLAVITYTNAATEKIKTELEKSIRIPPNLYIGTIHSFLDKFILLPNAFNLGITPDDLAFIEDLAIDDPQSKAAAVKNARDHGIITYSQIEWISEKIICGGTVNVKTESLRLPRSLARKYSLGVSKRIQFLFVDEYQDATIRQNKIFRELINANQMEYFYCVGDPEQYIYGFTYRGRDRRPNFSDIPIHQIEAVTGLETVTIVENHRSQQKIVDFINQFAKLQQTPVQGVSNSSPDIFFITGNNLEEIVGRFEEFCDEYQMEQDVKFYLSLAGNTFLTLELTEVSEFLDPSLRSDKLLSETLRCISGVLASSQKEIMQLKSWDTLDFRKIGLVILKKIKNEELDSEESLIEFLGTEYGLYPKFGSNDYSNTNTFQKILSTLRDQQSNPLNVRSTIHKSKGLEAGAVLVLARNKNELKKWLEIDETVRESDASDTCRVGFVAFSRAQKLLCLACLEETTDMYSQIESLGVVVDGEHRQQTLV